MFCLLIHLFTSVCVCVTCDTHAHRDTDTELVTAVVSVSDPHPATSEHLCAESEATLLAALVRKLMAFFTILSWSCGVKKSLMNNWPRKSWHGVRRTLSREYEKVRGSEELRSLMEEERRGENKNTKEEISWWEDEKMLEMKGQSFVFLRF